MEGFWEHIRKKRNTALSRQMISTILILLLGIALGVLSKFLDNTASNALPPILEYLDVRNFLGRFAIWMLLGLCIAVYSPSPIRAAVNVFAFFSGMLSRSDCGWTGVSMSLLPVIAIPGAARY